MDKLTQPRIAPAPDEDHYQEVIDEAERLVVFLGSGVNADDHDGTWQEDSGFLPDDEELARYLAQHIDWTHEPADLAEAAQRVHAFKDTKMFAWLRRVLAVDHAPGPVHTFLAQLPELLEEAGRQKHYPLIVTPVYDLALERALRAQNPSQPFDVAVYVRRDAQPRGSMGEEPSFVHLPWDAEYLDPKDIDVDNWKDGFSIPINAGNNEYNSFPIVNGPNGGELKRIVILRVNGAVDDSDAGFPWEKNYVITEDHYIDYLSDSAAVPKQIQAQLKESCCLFLGYNIADWRLRVFLKRIWENSETLGSAQHWAIERDPDKLELRLWARRAQLYQSRLSDYVNGLREFLDSEGATSDDRRRA
jgi:hypothetical protein